MEIELLPYKPQGTLPKHTALIEYSQNQEFNDALFIQACSLLQEETIKPIEAKWNVESNQVETFLNSTEFGFDVFAAIFYQLTRYEEYIPSPLDQFGRFDSSHSVFVGEQKELTPWVDRNVAILMEHLRQKFSDFEAHRKISSTQITMDVDIAYDYLGRKPLRATGAICKDILKPKKLLQRLRVLIGVKKDPAYIFEELKNKDITYFIHVGEYGPLDKNAGLSKKEFQGFLQNLKSKNIGLHPSFQSHLNLDELLYEQEQLEIISNHTIFKSRQHYIKLIIPDTFEILMQMGITEEYSMGWPNILGIQKTAPITLIIFSI